MRTIGFGPFLGADSWLHDVLSVTDLERRIYDRVTEIQDGLLAPRRYATSPVVAQALRLGRQAKLRSEEVEALGDAAIVAVALHAADLASLSVAAVAFESRGSADPDDEVRHFLRVARAYRRSSFLRRSLADAGRTAQVSAAALTRP